MTRWKSLTSTKSNFFGTVTIASIDTRLLTNMTCRRHEKTSKMVRWLEGMNNPGGARKHHPGASKFTKEIFSGSRVTA
jgi:hypothetical protein